MNFSKIKSLTKKQTNFLNRHVKGKWKFDPKTGLVNVDGDFINSYCGYKTLQEISFGYVTGDFFCSDNKLTSLKGAPQSVGGNFDCSDNKLKSLEGSPQSVGGNFYCSNNELISLEGAPKSVSGDFDCSDNELTSLKGIPKSLGGIFDCSGSKLTSLKGIKFKYLVCLTIEF